MKFEFNWSNRFWKKYVLTCCRVSNMRDLGRKVNLDLWNLIIAIVSLGLTYQVRVMTLALTILKKSTFQKKSHLNALGSEFDLDVHHRIIIWTNLVGPTPNATYKFPRSSAFWLWRRRYLKGFLAYMGMAAILVMWPGPFEQTFVPWS